MPTTLATRLQRLPKSHLAGARAGNQELERRENVARNGLFSMDSVGGWEWSHSQVLCWVT